MVPAAFRSLLLKSHNPYSIYTSNGWRSIVKASELANQDPVNDGAYRANKAALNMVAVGKRVEFGPAGLKVFAMLSG